MVLDWFKAYLSDYYQCFKIGSVLSDAKRVLYGVSCLLYTTPLSTVIQNHPGISFHFYADDTWLYDHLTHKNVTEAFNRLKTCLDEVKSGFLQTCLSLILIRQNLLYLDQGLFMQYTW